MAEEETTRGVRNPKVVDLISLDTKRDEVVLSMIEDRHWGESEEQLDQLEEKFNNYLDYILDGWLYSQYPVYQGKRCRIRVQGKELPDEEQARFFEIMQRFCTDNGIGFELEVEEGH
jgi:hypothetical protein